MHDAFAVGAVDSPIKMHKKCSYNKYTTLKAIYVRTQAIRLSLRANVLVGAVDSNSDS